MTMVPFRLTSAGGSDGDLGASNRSGADVPAMLRPPSTAPLLVEAYDAIEAARFRDAWSDLMGRCLEPNVFMEPDFCLPAAHHIAPARRPIFVLVWASCEQGRKSLVAVCPLLTPRLPRRLLAESWFHDLSARSGPLLDLDRAIPALQAILAWMAGRPSGRGGWLIPALAADGPTARAIEALARQTGRQVRRLDPRRRAILWHGTDEAAGLEAVSRKKAKDIRRQRRGLAALGTLGYDTATGGEDLRGALERFLLLEAQGWKGRRGTALLKRPDQAAFTRAMTRLLAGAGQCRIDSLTLDGKPIAMGIVLSCRNCDYFWKMTYDEAHASASPGVHFVLDLTERQRLARGVASTDSCALPDHPMIDHLWRGRLDLVDVVVAVSPGRSLLYRALVGLERFRRRARAGLKQTVLALRAARPGRP